jgi:hypothetical protein
VTQKQNQIDSMTLRLNYVGTNYNTLADLVARTEPDGSFARKIADRVGRTNELLQFLPFAQGNKPDGTVITQATKLPTVGYIKYNKAPTKSKGGTSQVTFNVGVLKTFSDIDPELVESFDNQAAFRESEDMLFVEAMNQQVASDLVYANGAVDREKPTGLATLYATPDTTRNNYGYYMLDAGGTGSDNMSIWLLALGDDGVSGLVGKNGTAGMSIKDHNKVWAADRDGNDMQWYRTEFRWEIGLQVRRPGAAVRICNIDASNLVSESSAADLSTLIQRAIGLIEPGLGRLVFLANRTGKTWLRIQASKETTLGLHDVQDTFGKPIPAIDGIPILQHDALTIAEAQVTGTFQSEL